MRVLVKGLEEISQGGRGLCAGTSSRARLGWSAGPDRRTPVLLDVIALNRDYAQATLEGLLANSVKVSEIGYGG